VATARYDPDRKPDSATWLDLDEDARIAKIVSYHRAKRVSLENERIHAIAHMLVENQIALGEPAQVPDTLARLMNEGLSRHDAVHAVGSVLLGVVFDVVRKPDAKHDPNTQYNQELAELTAARWRAGAEHDG
jgi:hypothetical protein